MAGNYVKGGSGDVNWASGLSQSLSGLSRSLLDQDKAKRDEQRLREAAEESRQRYVLEYNDRLEQRALDKARVEEERAYRREQDRLALEQRQVENQRAERNLQMRENTYQQGVEDRNEAKRKEADLTAQQSFVQNLDLDSFDMSSDQREGIESLEQQRSAVEGRLIEEENRLVSLVNTVDENGELTGYGQELYEKSLADAKKQYPELREAQLQQLARETVLQTHDEAKKALEKHGKFKTQVLSQADEEVKKGREALSANGISTGWYKRKFVEEGVKKAVEAEVPNAKSPEFRQALADRAAILGLPSKDEALAAQKSSIDEQIAITQDQYDAAKDLYETVIGKGSKGNKSGSSIKGMSPDDINTFAKTLGVLDGPAFIGGVDSFMESIDSSPELRDLANVDKDTIRAALASFVSSENARSEVFNNNPQSVDSNLGTDPEALNDVVEYVRGIVSEVESTGESKTLARQLTDSLKAYETRLQSLYTRKGNIRLGGLPEGVANIPDPNDRRFNAIIQTPEFAQNRVDRFIAENKQADALERLKEYREAQKKPDGAEEQKIEKSVKSNRLPSRIPASSISVTSGRPLATPQTFRSLGLPQ